MLVCMRRYRYQYAFVCVEYRKKISLHYSAMNRVTNASVHLKMQVEVCMHVHVWNMGKDVLVIYMILL